VRTQRAALAPSPIVIAPWQRKLSMCLEGLACGFVVRRLVICESSPGVLPTHSSHVGVQDAA